MGFSQNAIVNIENLFIIYLAKDVNERRELYIFK